MRTALYGSSFFSSALHELNKLPNDHGTAESQGILKVTHLRQN